jgi:hypothetical protein
MPIYILNIGFSLFYRKLLILSHVNYRVVPWITGIQHVLLATSQICHFLLCRCSELEDGEFESTSHD